MDTADTSGQTTKPFLTKRELRERQEMEEKLQTLSEEAMHAETLAQEFTHDGLRNPEHYQQYQGFNVLDVAEQLRAPDGTGGFNRGNAFKYLARAGWKDLGKEYGDLELAKYYIQREIDRLENAKSKDRRVEVGPHIVPRCEKCDNFMTMIRRDNDGLMMYECQSMLHGPFQLQLKQ